MSASSRFPKKKPSKAPRRGFDALEDRRVLAASLGFDASGPDLLYVANGSDFDDAMLAATAGGGDLHISISYSDPTPHLLSATLNSTDISLAELISGKKFGGIVFKGRDGNDTIDAFAVTNFPVILEGGKGNDTINGGKDNDQIFGDAGNDTLIGNDGDDVIRGNDGNDVLWGKGHKDSLFGGDGDDILNGDGLDFNPSGGTGGETPVSPGKNGFFEKTRGDDGGGDYFVAEPGSGKLSITNTDIEVLWGSDFDDTINSAKYSQAGGVVVFGSKGNDTLIGSKNADNLKGEDGDDLLEGGLGNDILEGGANGAAGDTITYVNSAKGMSVNLIGGTATSPAGGDGNDTFTGIENVTGSKHADHLVGNSGNNVIKGLAGSDLIFGSGGDDQIDAGDGDDFVEGGFGNDKIFGGAGVDEIAGNDGDDELDGGIGLDTIEGGIGNDIIHILHTDTVGPEVAPPGRTAPVIDADESLRGDVGNDIFRIRYAGYDAIIGAGVLPVLDPAVVAAVNAYLDDLVDDGKSDFEDTTDDLDFVIELP